MIVMKFSKLDRMKIVSEILAIQLSEPKTLHLENTNSSILICYLVPYSHGFLTIIMVIWGVSFSNEVYLNMNNVIIVKACCHNDHLRPRGSLSLAQSTSKFNQINMLREAKSM